MEVMESQRNNQSIDTSPRKHEVGVLGSGAVGLIASNLSSQDARDKKVE